MKAKEKLFEKEMECMAEKLSAMAKQIQFEGVFMQQKVECADYTVTIEINKKPKQKCRKLT